MKNLRDMSYEEIDDFSNTLLKPLAEKAAQRLLKEVLSGKAQLDFIDKDKALVTKIEERCVVKIQ